MRSVFELLNSNDMYFYDNTEHTNWLNLSLHYFVDNPIQKKVI